MSEFEYRTVRRSPRAAASSAAVLLAVIVLSNAGSVFPQAMPDERRDTLRLSDVIADVVQHNDRVAAMRYMETAAQSRIGPAGAWDDPMLMLGVNNLPTSFDFTEDMMTMKMIGLSQRFPYAGDKGLQKQAARADADAAAAMREATEVDLAAAARIAYANVYYRVRTLADLRHQRDLLQQVVASAQSKLTTNQTNQEDVAGAAADLWRLDAQILTAEQAVDAAWFDLAALRGTDGETPMPALAPPEESIAGSDLADWLTAAAENYPPLRRLRFEARSYGFSADAMRRMRWPMLELGASYGIREDGPDGPRDNMVGFQATLSLPLFRGRQQGNMAKAMDAMRLSTDAGAKQLWREVESHLRTLHRQAMRLSASLDLYRSRIIPAGEDAFTSAMAGYQSNRTSFITLLTYSVAIYRDRIAANAVANDLVRTMAEVARYTTDPASLTALPAGSR